MDEYEGGGRGGVEGGRKEKHPTPHIALNNEGLLGVWAICELGDREVYAGILLWVEEFHWLIMAVLSPCNLTKQREGTRRIIFFPKKKKRICMRTFVILKTPFCIQLSALGDSRLWPTPHNCSTLHTPNLSHHATQFSSLAVEYYRVGDVNTVEAGWEKT